MDTPKDIFSLPCLDTQIQSYALAYLEQTLAQQPIENSVDVYAVSAPSACLDCPYHKNRPNCNLCFDKYKPIVL